MKTARKMTDPDEFSGNEELRAILKKAGEAAAGTEVPAALDFVIRSAAAAQAEKNKISAAAQQRNRLIFRHIAWPAVAAMFVIVCSLSFLMPRQGHAVKVSGIDSCAIEQTLQKSAEFDADLTAFSMELNLNNEDYGHENSNQWYASIENDSIYQFNF